MFHQGSSKQSKPTNHKGPPLTTMAGYHWFKSGTRKQFPHNAVIVGMDEDGSQIYVGRTKFNGEEMPCKIVPRRNQAYVSYNCQEHQVQQYEVLCERKLQWVKNIGGNIPMGAVSGGKTAQGENLYIGRVHHGKSVTVGKVHPSHGCLYIPHGGKEHSYKDYEILVLRN